MIWRRSCSNIANIWKEIERNANDPGPGAPWKPFAAGASPTATCRVTQHSYGRLTQIRPGSTLWLSVSCAALT